MAFNRIKNFGKNVVYKTQKHIPEISLAVGLIAIPVAVGLAIKATLEVEEVVDEARGELFEIDKRVPEGEEPSEEVKKLKFKCYAKTGAKFAKLYAPTVAACSVAVGGVLYSYHVLNKRNLALTASLAGMKKSFDEYRKRVADKYGEDAEKDIRYGISQQVKTRIDEETGKEVEEVQETHEVKRDGGYGPYVKYFDSSSGYFEKNPEYNLAFLMKVQKYWNRQLQARPNGIVFLNEVLDSLDIPKTRAGQIAGWKFDPKNPCKIDFGIFVNEREANRRFVNGLEDTILLDFNCQADVYSELENII